MDLSQVLGTVTDQARNTWAGVRDYFKYPGGINMNATGTDYNSLMGLSNGFGIGGDATPGLSLGTSFEMPNNDLIASATTYNGPDLGGQSTLWSKFRDSSFKDQVSAVGSTVNAAANAYNAYNSVKLGKQQLGMQKDVWNKQYAAQRSTTNAAMADRQAARVASNPAAYASVDSYMNKYGIK